jgi:hypothetical protein
MAHRKKPEPEPLPFKALPVRSPSVYDQPPCACRRPERVISLGSRFKFLGVLRSLGTRRQNSRAFVDWQTYYRAYLGADSGTPLIQHSVPWVGDEARHTELINGLGAGHRAVVVWAPPGCGKSRFALELARRLETGPDRWEAHLVQHDAAAVREELPELAQQKRVVLILDDAQNCPDVVEILAAATSESLNLVCLVRSSSRSDVTSALNKALPPGSIQELDLGRPSAKLVRSLIDKLLSKTSPMHRDTIERFVRQSYFGAVFVGTLVSREKKLPQSFQRQYLRDRFCRQPLIEPTREVGPIEPVLRALSVFAALAPFSKDATAIREAAAQLSGLSLEKIQLLLERVVAAGLFQEDAHGRVRPIPDVLGDLILEEACLDMQGKPTPFSSDLLARAFELDAQTAMTNCAEIGQLFATASDVDLLSKLVMDRARTVIRDSRSAVMQLLQLCQPLTVRHPKTVLEVTTTLESRGVVRRDQPLAPDSIEVNVFGLLLSAAEADPTAVPVALKLGRDLYVSALESEPARRQVREYLDSTCGFEAGRNVAHGHAVALILQTWGADSNLQIAALAASLSGQFLRLDLKGHSELLQANADVWAVRDLAVDTLVRAISHTDARIQCAAIAALEHYAQVSGEQSLEAWLPQLERETGKLSAAMTKLVKETTSLPVWACVELQGWLWWARDPDVLHKAGATLLASLQDSDAYRLWKSLYTQRLPARTEVPTGVQDRRQYVQNLQPSEASQSVERARGLFDTLGAKEADAKAWRTLWLGVLDQTPAGRMDTHAEATLAEFARRQPTEAWSFITEPDAKGVLFAVVPALLVELRKLDPERASKVAQDVVPGTPLEAAWLQVLWSARDLNEGESTILARGLASTDAETVYRTAGALLEATQIDRVGAFKRVFTAVTHHPADEELWALVLEHFVQWTEGLLPGATPAATPTEPMSQVADGLTTLLQTQSTHIRWGYQRHTRQIPATLAALAILNPQRLEQWMRHTWGKPGGASGQWEDQNPLSVRRLRDAKSLLRGSEEGAASMELLKRWT